MKKNNYLPIISLSLILICFIGLYGLAVLKINALEQRNDELQANIENESSKLKDIDQIDIKKKAEDEENELSQLESFFIIQGQEFTLIQKVESLCQEASVTCEIKPVAVDTAEGLPSNFKSLHLIVTGKGKFSLLYKLGSVLENLPYKISINEMGLEQNEEGDAKENQWQEVFDFNVITKNS